MTQTMKEGKMQQERRATAYERWLEKEGVPVITGYHVDDVRTVELGPWPRLGGKGAYIHLHGAGGMNGMYICEIPPGGELNAERHLFEEVMFVIRGKGITQIRYEGQRTRSLEWQRGSLFSPPPNSWHKLINGSKEEAARLMAVTSAPIVVDLFRNEDFVFNNDFIFWDRDTGMDDYFSPGMTRLQGPRRAIYLTNFVPDVYAVQQQLPPQGFSRGEGYSSITFEMANNCIRTFIGSYPVGVYSTAHWHEPGYHILILQSQGYTLMWPRGIGIHPFSEGMADQVVRIDWHEGTVLVPPEGYYHQHFNTGNIPAKYMPTAFGGYQHPTLWDLAAIGGSHDMRAKGSKRGGNQIEYELEDPEIRKAYVKELAKAGLELMVPPLKSTTSYS